MKKTKKKENAKEIHKNKKFYEIYYEGRKYTKKEWRAMSIETIREVFKKYGRMTIDITPDPSILDLLELPR